MPDNDKDFSHYAEDGAALRRLLAMVEPKPKTPYLVASVWIRWALTAALLFGVYTETGVYTAISLALIFFSTEVIVWRLHENR